MSEREEEFDARNEAFKQKMFNAFSNIIPIIVINAKMNEEKLIAALQALEEDPDITLYPEFFKNLEKGFVNEEAYELANVIKNHIKYNYKDSKDGKD